MTLVFKEVESFETKKYQFLDYYIDIDICGKTVYQIWISKKNEGIKSFYIGVQQACYSSYDDFMDYAKSQIVSMIEMIEDDISCLEKGYTD